ncbi:hypothetical protein [Pseudomonas sp. NY15354]|uniref:hypothetical protein n=1 Tax=Pseudomonas sp. NY15354 TaxID=3400351 RepID=UPI003A840DA8
MADLILTAPVPCFQTIKLVHLFQPNLIGDRVHLFDGITPNRSSRFGGLEQRQQLLVESGLLFCNQNH